MYHLGCLGWQVTQTLTPNGFNTKEDLWSKVECLQGWLTPWFFILSSIWFPSIPLLWHPRPSSPALGCFPHGAKVAATAQASHSGAIHFCETKRDRLSLFLILGVSKLSPGSWSRIVSHAVLYSSLPEGMWLHVCLDKWRFSLELRIGQGIETWIKLGFHFLVGKYVSLSLSTIQPSWSLSIFAELSLGLPKGRDFLSLSI